MLLEVQEFVRLARSGAYMGGDRQVSPCERSRRRVTFRQLATDAQAAPRATDPVDQARLAQQRSNPGLA